MLSKVVQSLERRFPIGLPIFPNRGEGIFLILPTSSLGVWITDPAMDICSRIIQEFGAAHSVHHCNGVLFIKVLSIAVNRHFHMRLYAVGKTYKETNGILLPGRALRCSSMVGGLRSCCHLRRRPGRVSTSPWSGRLSPRRYTRLAS